MSSKSPQRFLYLWLALFICLLIPGEQATAANSIKVMSSARLHCTDALALAGIMGCKLVFQNDGSTANFSSGGKWINCIAGSTLAISSQGLYLLPTCPFRLNGTFYVPTQAVVEYFGGTVGDGKGGLVIKSAGKNSSVPLVKLQDDKPAGKDRLIEDLNDPRVPLSEYQNTVYITNQVRTILDAYVEKTAGAESVLVPLQLLLQTLGAGDVTVGAADKLLTAILAATDTAKNLQKLDDETSAPVREAMLSTYKAQQDPTNANVNKARRDWPDAIDASKKQLDMSQDLRGKISSVQNFAEILLTYMGKSSGETAKALSQASIQAIDSVCAQAMIGLAANKWHQETFIDYFSRLMEDTNSIPSGGLDEHPAIVGPNGPFTVVSMNVGNGKPFAATDIWKLAKGGPEETFVRDRLEKLNPDIAAILEVNDVDQLDAILPGPQDEYQIIGGPWDFICIRSSIIERVDRKAVHTATAGYVASNISYSDAGYMLCTLKGNGEQAPNIQVQIFYVHPDIPEENRRDAFQWVADRINPNIPVLVMGDFNTNVDRDPGGTVSPIVSILGDSFKNFNPSVHGTYTRTHLTAPSDTLDWVLGNGHVQMDSDSGKDSFVIDKRGNSKAYFDHEWLSGRVHFSPGMITMGLF